MNHISPQPVLSEHTSGRERMSYAEESNKHFWGRGRWNSYERYEWRKKGTRIAMVDMGGRFKRIIIMNLKSIGKSFGNRLSCLSEPFYQIPGISIHTHTWQYAIPIKVCVFVAPTGIFEKWKFLGS